LPDFDYDTGKPTQIGEYKLADETYGDLVEQLQFSKFNNLTEPLKKNILNYYDHLDTAALAKRYPYNWEQTYAAIQTIRATPPIKTDSLKNSKGIYYKLNEPDMNAVVKK
jgi:hypothetical protein